MSAPDTKPDREEALRKLDEESGERVFAFFRADAAMSVKEDGR